jgi:hypothetical protein
MNRRFKKDDYFGEVWLGFAALTLIGWILYFSFKSMGAI